MKLSKIIEATRKPEVYSKGNAEMWTDKYISERLLEVHLNPDIELASRKATTISLTVDWILEKFPDEELEILDLGCGPGLYAEKFAEKGHHVTGIDYSANSIQYADDAALRKKLSIDYRQENYLELADDNRYDLVMMIFTDFGVLTPEERKILLARVRRALKAKGMFLFDVLNKNYKAGELGRGNWDLATKGFWKDEPYLALTESFYYSEQHVSLIQHSIIDESENVDIYRFWNHTFAHDELKEILSENGFATSECYDRIIPGCDMYGSGDVTFCIAEK